MPQQQQPQSQMPSQAYANYTMGAPQVSFLFQSLAFHQFIMLYFGACYGVCFLLSGSYVDTMLTNGGLNHWSSQYCIPVGVYTWQA